MPAYIQRGQVPRKRHTVFRQPSGELYREHLMGALGFSGPSSLLYHGHPPTRIARTEAVRAVEFAADSNRTLRMRHFHLHDLVAGPHLLLDRVPVLFNQDVVMSLMELPVGAQEIYRNSQADEVIYISEGAGFLDSEFGRLAFEAGDYLVVPRGIAQRCDVGEATRGLVIESVSHIRFPRRYLTDEGQLMEHAPFCERDIRAPEFSPPREDSDEHTIIVKQDDYLTRITLDHHPFDVVGWDGCYYPFALSIHDFEPIVGALHQPPPVHQTFQADQFVICSFTPRLFDFHPDAIPAPYNHSNVMSDEVIYYANDEFMSRSGISFGSLTLHPAGIPHGPHPGRAEASIGKKRTDELAVMLDTFRPMHVAAHVLPVEDTDYSNSWLE